MNDFQQGFIRPRMRLIKSPWQAAQGTGSVKSAFQDVAGPMFSPRCLHVVASAPKSLKGGGCTFKTIECWTISPSVASLCKSYEDTLLCMQPKMPRGLNAQCKGQNPPTYGSVKIIDRINRGGSGGSSSNPSANVPKKASILVRSIGLTSSKNHLSSPTFVTSNSLALTFSPVTNPAPSWVEPNRRVGFMPCRPKVPKNGNRSQSLEGMTGDVGRDDGKELWRGLDAQRTKYVPANGHSSGDKEYKRKDVVPNMYTYVSSRVNRCPPNVVLAQTSKVRALIGFFEDKRSP